MTVKIPSSDRLSYRLMTEKDIDLFLDLDSDAEVMRHINGGTPTSKETFVNEYLPRLNAFTDFDKGFGMWSVTDISTNSFLGWILVRPVGFFSENKEEDNIELGWRFKQAAWGKGYATEAAKSVLEALTSQKNYRKFTAFAVPENTGSINIMKKLGMSFLKEEMEEGPTGKQLAVTYQLLC